MEVLLCVETFPLVNFASVARALPHPPTHPACGGRLRGAASLCHTECFKSHLAKVVPMQIHQLILHYH